MHILVNNSGGPPPGTVHGAEVAAFEAAYRQHLIANHVLAETVIPGMERDGYGRIVNVISTSVKEPMQGLGVSNTTRWAVASWAKTLATELARQGHHRQQRAARLDRNPAHRADHRQHRDQDRAQPRGGVRRRWCRRYRCGASRGPQETAAAIAFLCSPAASYITA